MYILSYSTPLQNNIYPSQFIGERKKLSSISKDTFIALSQRRFASNSVIEHLKATHEELKLLNKRGPRSVSLQEYMSTIPPLKVYLRDPVTLEQSKSQKTTQQADWPKFQQDFFHTVNKTICDMEILQKEHFIKALKEKGTEQEKIKLIEQMSTKDGKTGDEILDYSKVIRAQDEIEQGQINSKSHVVIIGSGPLPITAYAYANAGANVTLVDIDNQALNESKEIEPYLPATIKSKLHYLHHDGSTIDYGKPIAGRIMTHLFLASQAYPKQAILNRLLETATAEMNPIVIARSGKGDLSSLIYQPVEEDIFKSFITSNQSQGSKKLDNAASLVLKIKK